MGEITRAVLQSKCITSVPYWYTSQQTFTGGGSAVPVTVSGNIKTEEDSYFLLTQINYTGASGISGGLSNSIKVGSGALVTNPYGLPLSTFSLSNMTNNKEYFQSVTLLSDVCSDPCSATELFEYIYFAPGDRLKWTAQHKDTLTFAAGDIMFFAFGGIRFYMP